MQLLLLSLNYFSKVYTFKSSCYCLLFGNNPCCTSMKLSLNMQSRVKLAKMLMEPFTFLRLSSFFAKSPFFATNLYPPFTHFYQTRLKEVSNVPIKYIFPATTLFYTRYFCALEFFLRMQRGGQRCQWQSKVLQQNTGKRIFL